MATLSMLASFLAAKESKTRGIAWMLATYFWFLVLDSMVKAGLETMSLVEVTWGRFFFATVIAVIACGSRLPGLMRSDSPGIQTIRSIFLMITTGFFNAGIARVPLATASTIMYLSPIFVTILSIFVLKEKVGLRRWAGIAIGFVGAMIVISPDPSSSDPWLAINVGAVFLIIAALNNACYQIATRRLRHDDPMTSLLFTAAAGTLVTSLILPWFWTSPDLKGWLLLIGAGAAGVAGHFCLIRAFQCAPASVLAPFAYSSLLWASLFGYMFWDEVPTSNTILGAALIVFAGLYIFFRERRLKEAEAKEATT
jgi:drug/metabolite transporter (DMT)-like permease